MNDILAERALPDGRVIQVTPLTYSRARLNVGPVDVSWYDDGW